MDKEELKKHLFVLILCGGGGTRLWPSSRQKTPKQFSKILGEKIIFEETVERAKSIVPLDRIFVITLADYVDDVLEQGKIPLRNIIVEPMLRNTAMAMGVGAVAIQKRDPQAVIVNLASDHLISPLEQFTKEMVIATQAAQKGDFLVTVGIKPTFPHTGLGYIRTGKKFTTVEGKSIFKVLGFTEKPNLVTAKKFVKSGDYYWNLNLYTWTVTSALKAFQKLAPKIYKGIQEISKVLGTEDEDKVMRAVYSRTESIQIDYAISEKAKNLLLLQAKFSWTDIGDWGIVYDISKKDKDGNAILKFGEKGEFLGLDAKNNLVHFDDQLIAAIGVEDLIIVDTKDAILICKKDKAEDVKKMVQLLKKKGKEEYL